MNYVDITPAMTADACTINGRDYVASADSVQAYNRTSYMALHNIGLWYSDNILFPHWWEIDMGGYSLLSEFSFCPSDDVVDVLVKDYKIEYSLDGITWHTIFNGTNTQDTAATRNNSASIVHTLQIPVIFRYLKLTILNGYNSRGYVWSGIYNVKLTGVLDARNKTYKDLMNDLYGYK